MTKKEQAEITTLCQQFAEGFKELTPINGSGWLIVDPLSGWLNAAGIPNTPHEMPATPKHPQVLVLEFADGSKFIPAGDDLKPLNQGFHNWMWL